MRYEIKVRLSPNKFDEKVNASRLGQLKVKLKEGINKAGHMSAFEVHAATSAKKQSYEQLAPIRRQQFGDITRNEGDTSTSNLNRATPLGLRGEGAGICVRILSLFFAA